MYDLETGDIFVSRDVKFHENEFPFVTSGDSTLSHVSVEGESNVDGGIDFDFLDDLEHVLEVGETSTELGSRDSSDCTLLDTPNPSPNATPATTPAATPLDAAGSLVRDTPAATSADRSSHAAATASGMGSSTGDDPSSSPLVLGRGQRPRHSPGWHHTDESAVEQILAEAMDHCVLQQVAAINCSSFSHSVLPSNLESRFQRLKTFPSSSASSSNPSKPVPKPQLGPNSANELKNSVTELKDEKPISDDFVKTPEKTPEKEKKSDRKSGSGYLSSSGSSNSSSGYLNSPNNRGKQGVKKGKDGNFSSGSSNSGLKASTKSVKTGCFWCSPKRVSRKKSDGGGSTRNRAFELGDDWGKHDEILSDLRLDFSINDDLSDDDSDYSFGHH
uniref:Uncharacterized protein n=1 Tax=Chenopodium quinoa TaxID=63459 RepID=A0A803M2D7_CHEQI